MKTKLITAGLILMAGISIAQTWNTSSGHMYLTPASARLGLGSISSAAYQLDIGLSNPGGDGIRISQNGSSGEATIRMENNSSGGHKYGIFAFGAGNPSPGAFEIYDYTSSADRLFIATNGNTGINTNAPAAKLHVVDATAAEILVQTISTNDAKIRVANGWGSYSFLIDNNMEGHIQSGTNILNFKNTGLPANPQVWIGANTPLSPHNDFNFAVEGKIVAQSVYVTAPGPGNWADYVFADDYKLPTLKEIEKFYKENRHLPEIPTTAEVSEKGINVGEMHTLLLKKVEELTLYVVDLNKKIERLQEENAKLKGNK